MKEQLSSLETRGFLVYKNLREIFHYLHVRNRAHANRSFENWHVVNICVRCRWSVFDDDALLWIVPQTKEEVDYYGNGSYVEDDYCRVAWQIIVRSQEANRQLLSARRPKCRRCDGRDGGFH